MLLFLVNLEYVSVFRTFYVLKDAEPDEKTRQDSQGKKFLILV